MAMRQRTGVSAAALTTENVERMLNRAGIFTRTDAGGIYVPPDFVRRLAENGDRARVQLVRDVIRASKRPAVLELLRNADIAAAFIRDPKNFSFQLNQIAQAASGREGGTIQLGGRREESELSRLISFLNRSPAVASLLASSPSSFARLSRMECAHDALRALEVAAIGGAFRRSPEAVASAIEHISAHAGPDGARAFLLRLGNERNLAQAFARNPSAFSAMAAGTRAGFMPALEALGSTLAPDAFVARAFSMRDDCAIELGRHIDDLHDRAAERRRYISGLGMPQVVGLLCSNPELFYTSSNNLLFERLRKDLSGGGLSRLRESYGLNGVQLRNFIFRAANYGRLGDFLREPEDARLALGIMMGSRTERTGIFSDSFDARYFYLLANSIGSVSRYAPDILREMDGRINELGRGLERRPESERRIYHSLRYARYVLSGQAAGDRTLERERRRSTFRLDDYRAADGRVAVLQVFDREDTERSHWPLTQRFLEARGYRRTGSRRVGEGTEAGTLVTYERSGVRMNLFMGDTEEANRAFARRWVSQNRRGLVTFRGHSYSLALNLPPETFGNRAGRYVFIPGSCGSAGSIPMYITSNPGTDIRFFSNTSTGRGQVTNSLLEILLSQRGSAEFSAILQSNSRRIAAAGGDASLIRALSPGEALLNYVNGMVAARGMRAGQPQG